MSNCDTPASVTVPCPGDVSLYYGALLGCLPLGWAWDALNEPTTIMARRLSVLAQLFQLFHEQSCALLPEFHCFSADLTLESWWADYGLPDDCGINDLCVKMAALGGQNCASYIDLGDALGIDICCQEIPPELQCGCWQLGVDQMAPSSVESGVQDYVGTAHHWITGLSTDTAYTPTDAYVISGCWELGIASLCTPAAEPVFCFINRNKPAHTKVIRRYCDA